MQRFKGIYISHRVKDKKSKKAAEDSLYGWKPAELTGEQWIDKLAKGQTIQPSTFRRTAKGTYSHAVEHWVETHFVMADGDYIKGVEFTDEGIDKNPYGIDPFQDPKLFSLYPTLERDLYAIAQSVSSMSFDKPPPHKRYRLIFQTDEPITSEAQYHAILLALAEIYPIIAPIKRSPAQPVFGNARPETSETRIFGNTLRLSDYPSPPVEKGVGSGVATAGYGTRKQNKPCQIQSGTPATDADLETYLAHNNIERTPREKGGFFIKCENTSNHTGGICKPKDAYVFVSDQGGFAKYCSHTSCKSSGRNTWQSFRIGYSLHTPPEISQRYTPKYPGSIPTYRREIKLTAPDILSDIKRETLEDAQSFIEKVLNSDLSGQVFVVRVDTGAGKTEYAILIKGARPILLVGSHDLGTEIYSRAKTKGVTAFLYRGLMHKPDGEFPFESPCIKPTVLDEYRKKGADAFRWGCEGCEMRQICQQQGMRWQHEQLSDPDSLIILAIPQLFIDPRYRSFLKNRIKLSVDDIVMVDDASTENLFLNESISLEFLTEKIKNWKGVALGEFAKAVKDIITENEAVSLITQLQSLVRSTLKDANKRTTLYRQLKKSRHYDPHSKQHIELSIDDAIEKEYVNTKTTEDRQKLQTVEKEGWTTLDRLRIFFKAYPNPETAPMHYDETEHILHFTLPPQLYQTDAAIGFMGATIDLDVFRSMFAKGTRYVKEPQVYDAASTEYHPDSTRYQLRTNGNPRATLLKYQGKGELSNTGLEFFGYFKRFVESNPSQKHALITYKSVIEHYQTELDALGIAYSWFHNTEGLDTRFADAEVFHVFGMPARNPLNVEWAAKTWGISEDEVRSRLITQELQQAIGRGRLVRKPNTLILYTSHPVDNYTDRCELTDEHDWQAAGFQLSQLPTVISERQAQEKAHQETVDAAIQSGDVEAVMETKQVGKSKAYDDTKDTRPQIKAEQDAERDAEILRILQNNPDTSMRNITDQLKASGHKRTDRKYIKQFVEQNRRGKIPRDNYNVNCPVEKIRSPEPVPSQDVLSQVNAFFNCDGALHTPEKIASTIGSELCAVRAACQELYKAVKLSQGHGETYWRGQSKRTASEMTAEQTADRLRAGIHPDGTPITEREPQPTADISALPPHLRAFCEPVEIPKHLQRLYETIQIPKQLQKYHSRYKRYPSLETLQAYKSEADRLFTTGEHPKDIAKTLHVPYLVVRQWLEKIPCP